MGQNFLAAAVLAALLVSVAGPAPAQTDPGQDVTVNPSASGSQLLLYPDGQHVRTVPPLLQPGEPDPNVPLRLHMPVRHKLHRVARQRPAAPKTETAAAAPPPAAAPQDSASFSDLPTESAARLVGATPAPKQPVRQKPTAPPKPAPVKQAAVPKSAPSAKPAPAAETIDAGGGFFPDLVAPQQQKPARVATAEPEVPATTDLDKRSSIVFAPGAEEPAPAVLDDVRAMAGELGTALSSGSARIQLFAYGGKQGDKSSDARRLSLKRALIIRQLLIDDGIPSERIDTHAMGGAPGAPLDRVDVYVRV